MTEVGHLGGYYDIGRTEVEPLPADPDFKNTGIWWRAGAYPASCAGRGSRQRRIRYRYWDRDRGRRRVGFPLGTTRRVRRVNETILSSSPGLTTWDADHAGGFAAKPQEYNFKYLGEQNMLGMRACEELARASMPDRRRRTSCNDDWEMRHLYVVEVTPRPERLQGVLQSKTIVYVDGEVWFNPYVDSYDRKGELWKTQIYLIDVSRPPGARREDRDLSVQARVHPRRLEHRRANRPVRRPATCRARTPPSANAGTSTWARWTRVLHNRRDGQSGPLKGRA